MSSSEPDWVSINTPDFQTESDINMHQVDRTAEFLLNYFLRQEGNAGKKTIGAPCQCIVALIEYLTFGTIASVHGHFPVQQGKNADLRAFCSQNLLVGSCASELVY